MADNHGSTPAAWTAVVLAIIAFGVGGAGLVAGSWLTFWVGVGLLVLSVVVGKVMGVMGMGAHTG